MGARAETGKVTNVDIDHHPFSDSIISAPLPERFKLPMMQKYDGSSDAAEHLAAFSAHMLFYADIATDALKCRAFPTTLTKFALRWFFTLPPNSINSFSDLCAQFLERHALTIGSRKDCTTNALRDFQQGHNESLRDYIKRFNQIAMQIKDLHPDFAIATISEGLNPGPCAALLTVNPPQNLRELQRTVSICIDCEERRNTKSYRGK